MISAARSAFPRQVPREARFRSDSSWPATVPAVLPPLGRLPTRFRPPSARAGGARPERRGRIHAAEAKRRLSTSAIETNREHDHVIARTPLTRRAVAHAQSSSRPPPFGDARSCGWPRSFRNEPTKLSQARSRGETPPHFLPRSLAERALSRPAPLGHLLSRARDLGWLGAPAKASIRRCFCVPARRAPLSQSPP